MDSGVMSPGFGGIIWSRVVRGAGGSTKACAVAAAKHSRRSSMVVASSYDSVRSVQRAGKELAEAACFSEARWGPELAETSSAHFRGLYLQFV